MHYFIEKLGTVRRVEKKLFVFVFSQKLRKNFFSLFAKKVYENFVFAKIFHLECGSGFRSTLNEYPDPKHWLKIFAKQKFFSKTIPGTTIFSENENFRESKSFREKWANFRLFSLFAKMKKRVFVSTLTVPMRKA
jgi:hypothetical protein